MFFFRNNDIQKEYLEYNSAMLIQSVYRCYIQKKKYNQILLDLKIKNKFFSKWNLLVKANRIQIKMNINDIKKRQNNSELSCFEKKAKKIRKEKIYHFYEPINSSQNIRLRKYNRYDPYGILNVNTYRNDLRHFINSNYNVDNINSNNYLNITRSCIKDMGKNLFQIMNCINTDYNKNNLYTTNLNYQNQILKYKKNI